MNKYLQPGKDADAFVDYPFMKPAPQYSLTKMCPVCFGHGGWNLTLNVYPLHDKPDTAENRHKFSHFRAHCSHCNGWGYVREDEMCTGHEWVFVRNTGNCLNLHKCKHCGKEWEIDSSD